MHKRVSHIDGLKGLCAIFVVIVHYFIAFGHFGYIGWQSNVEHAEKIAYYWDLFPFSAISNGTFILYIFFSLIAFIPAVRFFTQNDIEWVKQQALTRYFRFAPYVLAVTLLSYVFYINGWYFNQELGKLLDINWNLVMFTGADFSWADAFISALFRSMIINDNAYVTVLWCMHVIFLGSYISYFILILFGSLRHRFIFYALFLALCAYAPLFISFIVGIIVADIYSHYTKKIAPYITYSLLACGLFAAVFSELVIDSFSLKMYIQNLGIFFILLSVLYTEALQKALSHPFLLACASYSFEVILVHMIVLFSVSAWIFINTYHLGYAIALIITGIASIVINVIACVLFAKIMNPIHTVTMKLVKNIVT